MQGENFRFIVHLCFSGRLTSGISRTLLLFNFLVAFGCSALTGAEVPSVAARRNSVLDRQRRQWRGRDLCVTFLFLDANGC